MTNNITFISAGAGSGKTYTLTETLEKLLVANEVAPSGVMATTFTRLAAGELKERVRSKLIESGHLALANQMEQAVIGTVNSVCGELLKRFAFEAGMPPDLKVIDDEDNALLLNSAMEITLQGDPDLVQQMNAAAIRLDMLDRNKRLQWRAQVRDIVKQARSNNQGAETVLAQGAASADSLLTHFREPTARDLNQQLVAAIDQTLASIDTEHDATKVTAKYLDRLREAKNAMQRDRFKWPDWFTLATEAPGKKSCEQAEAVQTLAAEVEVHPGLQNDIRWFTETLFAIAANTLQAYQDLKTRKGLIDFVDQEQRVYALLDNPVVASTLQQELQLLMVDEFQDTSPIQLALFLKLSGLVKRVIWVGDIKQSIYGFRGSDPSLMTAVVDRVVADGNPPKILERSWRSTPALVAYANALFVPAFSNTLAREQVALLPARDDSAAATSEDARAGEDAATSEENAIEHWTLEGGRKAQRAAALANGVVELLANGRQVFDKQLEQWRDIGYRDVAILCRTNDNLGEAAAALAEVNIPVRYKRKNLLATPEGTLAFACLRRLVDPSDTLASAEIHSLVSCEDPEVWLADRLAYLDDPEHRAYQWLEDDNEHPVARLKAQRERLAFLTPVEALRVALDAGEVRRAVYRWGPSAARARHRLNNLSALIAHAEDYQSRAATFNEPVSTTGLILWLAQLADSEEDKQASGGDDNAVHLVTHHGAKGLEWPIVIAMDVDHPLRPRIWGLNVVAAQGALDLTDPLAGRCLQYWCRFSNRRGDETPLLSRIAASERVQQANQAETEEMKRLLYVSITRARDGLILPLASKSKRDGWMTSVASEVLLPESDALALPCGTTIATCVRTFDEASGEAPSKTAFEPRWLFTGNEPTVRRHLKVSPSSAPALTQAVVGEQVVLGEPLEIGAEYQPDKLGSALHAVIATTLMGQLATERILDQHGVLDTIDVAAANTCAERLQAAIAERFSPLTIAVEYPMQYLNDNGQQVQGWIDCLLETDQGWVLIDHKAANITQAQWAEVALKYSGQLASYAEGVARITGTPVVSQWVHFGVSGGLVEVCGPD